MCDKKNNVHFKINFNANSNFEISSNFVAPSASANNITAPLLLCTP